jgi:probable rRNA maturation factor
MKVDIRMEVPQRDPEIKRSIRTAAAAMARQVDLPEGASLSVLVTGDAEIQALNLQFLEIDAPTDVLAFPAGDPLEGDAPYLGDIIISLETAARQAEAGRHTLGREVELLVVHAMLHLLGHDHGAADDKTAMWTAQAAVLETLGNPLSPP